jgi:ssDNA-binding Zn-finger/Zn-ribbon topoisomerase 1
MGQWDEGVSRAFNDEEEAEPMFDEPLRITGCLWCGARAVKRKSRFGPFFGCSTFPRCRWSMSDKGDAYLDQPREDD